MTRFEEFKEAAKADLTSYRQMMNDTKVWEFKEQVKQLQEFQIKLSGRLMLHMFGQHLGEHMWEGFRRENMCILSWFNRLDEESYIYVLHEIKNNRTLYAYS